ERSLGSRVALAQLDFKGLGIPMRFVHAIREELRLQSTSSPDDAGPRSRPESPACASRVPDRRVPQASGNARQTGGVPKMAKSVFCAKAPEAAVERHIQRLKQARDAKLRSTPSPFETLKATFAAPLRRQVCATFTAQALSPRTGCISPRRLDHPGQKPLAGDVLSRCRSSYSRLGSSAATAAQQQQRQQQLKQQEEEEEEQQQQQPEEEEEAQHSSRNSSNNDAAATAAQQQQRQQEEEEKQQQQQPEEEEEQQLRTTTAFIMDYTEKPRGTQQQPATTSSTTSSTTTVTEAAETAAPPGAEEEGLQKPQVAEEGSGLDESGSERGCPEHPELAGTFRILGPTAERIMTPPDDNPGPVSVDEVQLQEELFTPPVLTEELFTSHILAGEDWRTGSGEASEQARAVDT
ncbi:unnamed protein product, partial [Polarella glacialis]